MCALIIVSGPSVALVLDSILKISKPGNPPIEHNALPFKRKTASLALTDIAATRHIDQRRDR
jgi:hypothetical protein